ncbi:hypothetical protein EDC94DRAFT_600924 [Helicostylum pulchrum]|nr:hypothetical protein EDC94DRAFT_600924 [Helicostylum pulchrum]
MLCDLTRTGCFSKEAIDTYCNYGTLGIHAVGFHINFYATTLLAEGLYLMLEICSIRLPSSLFDTYEIFHCQY